MPRTRLTPALLALALVVLAAVRPATGSGRVQCEPTPPDMLGPFYKPGAPFRQSVGQGYLLTGTVLSAPDCQPVRGALVELWLVGPDGRYDDEHRASLYSDDAGRYAFQSNLPPPYAGRPSHIHILVTAPGFKPLITQHYPAGGLTGTTFDLILIPDRPARERKEPKRPFLRSN